MGRATVLLSRLCSGWRQAASRSLAGPATERGSGDPCGLSGVGQVVSVTRSEPSQAWGRCRSSACTMPSAVRCATRNSPVTSFVGGISSAYRT